MSNDPPLPSFKEIENPTSPHASGRIGCFQFRRLAREPGLAHAVFTRHGGVSGPPFSSLNASYSTGDDPDRVRQNLAAIRKVIGAGELLFLDQVHGREILVLHRDDPRGFPQGAQADAVLTDRRLLAVMIKQADCQAVLFYDPAKAVVAAVHCGWRGNVLNILGSVVERMVSEFGCRRSGLLGAVGPSLGPCCAEFKSYREIFPVHFRSSMVRENYFDLWQISRRQMLEAGLEERNIEVAGLCTVCRTDLFFSHRGEKRTGRFATAAMLT
jgi:YfiH family protein